MARLPRLYFPEVAQLVQAEFLQPLGTPADPTPSAQLDMLLGWHRDEAGSQGVSTAASTMEAG